MPTIGVSCHEDCGKVFRCCSASDAPPSVTVATDALVCVQALRGALALIANVTESATFVWSLDGLQIKVLPMGLPSMG